MEKINFPKGAQFYTQEEGKHPIFYRYVEEKYNDGTIQKVLQYYGDFGWKDSTCVKIFIEQNKDYWNCKCDENYVHIKTKGNYCPRCGAYAEDQPDSMEEEVKRLYIPSQDVCENRDSSYDDEPEDKFQIILEAIQNEETEKYQTMIQKLSLEETKQLFTFLAEKGKEQGFEIRLFIDKEKHGRNT